VGDDLVVESWPGKGSFKNPEKRGVTLNETKILIVDDHTVLRKGLRLILEGEQGIMVVGEATRGSEVVEMCGSLKPDVVLLDLTLPDQNGLEVLKELKEKWPVIKVIILTMHDDEAYLKRAIQGGANGYILKNAAATDLIFAIKIVLRGEMFVDPALTKTLFAAIRSREATAHARKKPLSDREKQVLQLVALGYTSQDIAGVLAISAKTVESHKSRIKDKLDITRRSDLVKHALSDGLLDEE
jgi:two-component system, NarL family, response regulator NreC